LPVAVHRETRKDKPETKLDHLTENSKVKRGKVSLKSRKGGDFSKENKNTPTGPKKQVKGGLGGTRVTGGPLNRHSEKLTIPSGERSKGT